ncbi:MAG TPA: type II toxin-antitoxin system Phd/YefM family antitoxin [Pseudomonadales bacterium]|nr:type II toxin-antitoxin system Phd/YefM family antitoxin [Pseudomonadales bacterium]
MTGLWRTLLAPSSDLKPTNTCENYCGPKSYKEQQAWPNWIGIWIWPQTDCRQKNNKEQRAPTYNSEPKPDFEPTIGEILNHFLVAPLTAERLNHADVICSIDSDNVFFLAFLSVLKCTKQRYVMNAIVSAACQNLAKTMDRVCSNHEPIITHNSELSVAMISLEDFNASEETAYLLRSPKNTKRLLESIAHLEAGGTEKVLDD